jgi:hypothetical protein
MSDDSTEPMIKIGQALLGFMIAPVTPCIMVLVVAMFQAGRDDGTIMFSIMLPISYITSLIVGAPIHIILTWIKWTRLKHYIMAAILATLAPILAIFIYPAVTTCESFSSCILPSHYAIMGVMFLAGILVAATFWLIVRPDRAMA